MLFHFTSVKFNLWELFLFFVFYMLTTCITLGPLLISNFYEHICTSQFSTFILLFWRVYSTFGVIALHERGAL